MEEGHALAERDEGQAAQGHAAALFSQAQV